MERMDDRLTKKDEELETSIEDLESSFDSSIQRIGPNFISNTSYCSFLSFNNDLAR